MPYDPRTLGWLEKIWFAALASLKAHLYILFHWDTEYRMEYSHRRTGEEEVLFIGAVKFEDGEWQVVRTYYGKSGLVS